MMNPPTLLRKFISLFWLKKDGFQLAINKTKTWKQRSEFKEKKVEDCAWTPVVDETLLKVLESVEHKSGWYPFENGHAQVAYRAMALRTSWRSWRACKNSAFFSCHPPRRRDLAACKRMRMFLMARMFAVVISGE